MNRIPARLPRNPSIPVRESALGRVFNILQEGHRITAVMYSHPSPGPRAADWSGPPTPADLDCAGWAQFQGNPGRWVGVHLGSTDRGQSYWDNGDLRYWDSKGLVEEVWFSYSDDPDVPGTLLRVLRDVGLNPVWDGPGTVISVLLPGVSS